MNFGTFGEKDSDVVVIMALSAVNSAIVLFVANITVVATVVVHECHRDELAQLSNRQLTSARNSRLDSKIEYL